MVMLKHMLAFIVFVLITSTSNAKWYEYSREHSYTNVNAANIGIEGRMITFYQLEIKNSWYFIIKVLVDCSNYDHAMLEVTKYEGSPGAYERYVANKPLGEFENGIGKGVVGITPVLEKNIFPKDQLSWFKHKTWSRSIRHSYELLCKVTKIKQ